MKNISGGGPRLRKSKKPSLASGRTIGGAARARPSPLMRSRPEGATVAWKIGTGGNEHFES